MNHFIPFEPAALDPLTQSATLNLSKLPSQVASGVRRYATAGGLVNAGAAVGIAPVKKSGETIEVSGIPDEAWRLITAGVYVGAAIVTNDSGTVSRMMFIDNPKDFSIFTPEGFARYADAPFAKRLRVGLSRSESEVETMLKKSDAPSDEETENQALAHILAELKSHQQNRKGNMGLEELRREAVHAAHTYARDVNIDPHRLARRAVAAVLGGNSTETKQEKMQKSNDSPLRKALGEMYANPRIIRGASFSKSAGDPLETSLARAGLAQSETPFSRLGKALEIVRQHPRQLPRRPVISRA